MRIHVRQKVAILVLAVVAVSVTGCMGSAPSRVTPQGIASDAASKAMELYDANHDGQLDSAELDKAPGLKAALKQVDKNGDGKISADEINARINDWKESKLGRMSISCRVLHGGMPLAGAKVVFEPESFLGDQLKSGSGTTDANGTVSIAMDPSVAGDLPGMSPGFYRVRITKDGEKIPATYNTETTLGQEIAQDAAGIVGGIKFDLKY